MTRAPVSIGVAGSVGPAAIAVIAAAVEREGLHALWVNDTPAGDSLAGLHAAAAVTTRITLATGVIPVDRVPAAEIPVRARGLPADRLVLGIGSGAASGRVLAPMRDAVRTVRAGTGARVVVGALGPKMRELAATSADGVLLNWLTPDAASDQAARAHELAPATRVVLYVRTALDEAGMPRLRDEVERYGASPAYAANFARLGIVPGDTVLTAADAADRLPAYRDAVDEVVLRVITGTDSSGAYERFVEHAAALAR